MQLATTGKKEMLPGDPYIHTYRKPHSISGIFYSIEHDLPQSTTYNPRTTQTGRGTTLQDGIEGRNKEARERPNTRVEERKSAYVLNIRQPALPRLLEVQPP